MLCLFPDIYQDCQLCLSDNQARVSTLPISYFLMRWMRAEFVLEEAAEKNGMKVTATPQQKNSPALFSNGTTIDI